MFRLLILVFLTFATLPGWSKCGCTLSVGPEVYHMSRIRIGGTHQEGWIDGVRLGFDRIKKYCWYFGGDLLYAKGELKGATGTGRPLVSELTDQIYEIRLGYTLQKEGCYAHFFVPFAGWGHFREINQFSPPSPIPCTFTDSFSYWTAGFLSGVNFKTLLSIGLNFKLRFMHNGQSEVTEDPLYDDVTLLMKDEIHVRVDLPIALTSPTSCVMGFLLTPFFEYRHFGGREGFPFNFKDTKFYLYGARFALTYQF